MAYNKQNWRWDTRMSPDMMNHIEDAIESLYNKIDVLDKDLAENKVKKQIINVPLIDIHNGDGSAHHALFSQMRSDLQAKQEEIDELKKTIASMKGTITKLSNKVKSLESSK